MNAPLARMFGAAALTASLCAQGPKLEGTTTWRGTLEADSAYGTVRVAGVELELRYRQSSLLGEPVASYVVRYTIAGPVTLADGATITVANGLSGGREAEFDDEASPPSARVDARLLRFVTLEDFWFVLETAPSPLFAAPRYLGMHNPGVLGKPGEWGWDTPGSPGWGNLLATSPDVVSGQPPQIGPRSYLDRDAAKRDWQALLDNGASVAGGAWRVHSVLGAHVDIGALLSAIERSRPGVGQHLIGAARGASHEAATIAPMLDDFERALAEGLTADGGMPDGKLRADLERRRALLDQFVAAKTYDGSLLQQRWKQLQQRFEHLDAMREVAKLGEEVERTVRSLQPGSTLDGSPQDSRLRELRARYGNDRAATDALDRVQRLMSPGADAIYAVCRVHHSVLPQLVLTSGTSKLSRDELDAFERRRRREREQSERDATQACPPAMRSEILELRVPPGVVGTDGIDWSRIDATALAALKTWADEALKAHGRHYGFSDHRVMPYFGASYYTSRAEAQQACDEQPAKVVPITGPPPELRPARR